MKSIMMIACLVVLSCCCFAQKVVQVEYSVDADLGVAKNKLVNVTPSADSTFSFTANLTGIAPGYHLLYIRTKDSNGNWSLTSRRPIEVLPTLSSAKVSATEYFFDTDPGIGAGKSITISPQDSAVLQNFTAVTSTLQVGYHKLYIRTKDSIGNWSLTTRQNVEIIKTEAKIKITAAEYFFDTDPGIGAGKSITVSPQDSAVLQNFTVVTSTLQPGYHKLYIRTRDSSGNWSLTTRQNVEIIPAATTAKALSAEYFFSTDAGFGSCLSAIFPVPAVDSTFSFFIPKANFPAGADTFFIRVKDSDNKWSLTQIKAIPLSQQRSALSKSYSAINPSLEENKGLTVAVIPNPVRGDNAALNIYSKRREAAKLVISNVEGAIVCVQSIQLEAGKFVRTINVNSLPAGTYLVHVLSENKSAFCKMLKQ